MTTIISLICSRNDYFAHRDWFPYWGEFSVVCCRFSQCDASADDDQMVVRQAIEVGM